MGKLDKLSEAVRNGDNSSFINTIFDFLDEDIIELTEEEFEDILKYSTKIKIDGVKEFFDFLFEEGLRAIQNSNIERVRENAFITHLRQIQANIHIGKAPYA